MLDIRRSQFTPEVEAEVRRLAGTMPIREIPTRLRVNVHTLKWWAGRHQLKLARPDANVPTVYTDDRVARIESLLGHATARQIASEVGVSVASLKSWCKRKGYTLARPASQTLVGRYNRVRQRAEHAGRKSESVGLDQGSFDPRRRRAVSEAP
jgi:uncharacterized protein YjcR